MNIGPKDFAILFLTTLVSMTVVGMITNLFTQNMDLIIFITCVIGMSVGMLVMGKYTLKFTIKKSMIEALRFLITMAIGFGLILLILR